MLIDQLKPGGRMVVPVQDRSGFQHLMKIDKDSQGKVSYEPITGVRYVPLADRNEYSTHY